MLGVVGTVLGCLASTVGWLKISKTRMTGRLALLGSCFKWMSSWWHGLEQSHAFRSPCWQQKARQEGMEATSMDPMIFYLNVGIQNWSHSFIEVKIQQLHWLHASASIAFNAEGQAEASTSTRVTTFWLIFMFKLSWYRFWWWSAVMQAANRAAMEQTTKVFSCPGCPFHF